MAGHGGGAWKVALADFMTALMAFFLVMWILAQRPDLLEGTAKYFRDPPKIKMPWTTGVLKNEAKEAVVRDINTKKTLDSSSMNSATAEQKRLNAIAMGFYGMINVKYILRISCINNFYVRLKILISFRIVNCNI